MPKLDFTLFNANKRKERVNSGIVNTYSVIKKGVLGVISITLEGDYFVITDDGNYKLSDDSYIIKSNQPYYAQQIVNGKRLSIIEINTSKKKFNENLYLPFAPGVCCIGSIVLNTKLNIKVYKLKRTYIDKYNQIAIDAWNFFNKNYDIIRDKINAKYRNI